MRSILYTLLVRFSRPLRFGLVGASGMVVNSTVLWALVTGAELPVLLASALATETAILSNFLLNDRWTFRAAAQRDQLGQRLLRYNGVALGGMAITTTVLSALTLHGRLHLLLANLFAVGAAMVWNYIVNSRWTWKRTARGTGQLLLEIRPIVSAQNAEDAKKSMRPPFRSPLRSSRFVCLAERLVATPNLQSGALWANLQSAPSDSPVAHVVEEVSL